MRKTNVEGGRGDSCLCLACGQQFEAKPEQSGERPAALLFCPSCRSSHVLNLTVGANGSGCGSSSGLGFSFG